MATTIQKKKKSVYAWCYGKGQGVILIPEGDMNVNCQVVIDTPQKSTNVNLTDILKELWNTKTHLIFIKLYQFV